MTTRCALFVTLFGWAVAGCSGASAGTGGSGGSGGSVNDGWTGRTNVEAIFESYCSRCHGDQWSTCWDVQGSASEVDYMISSGQMPRVGTLTPLDKSTLLGWLGGGAPCSGARPSNSGGMDDAGGPPVGFAETP
jgi:hypothetical protein